MSSSYLLHLLILLSLSLHSLADRHLSEHAKSIISSRSLVRVRLPYKHYTSSTMMTPTTTTTIASSTVTESIEERAQFIRVWNHNHDVIVPLIILCALAILFLCFSQIGLIMIKRRLVTINEITVSISASQLKELSEKQKKKDQEIFTIPMPPPPYYTSEEYMNECGKEEVSYISMA